MTASEFRTRLKRLKLRQSWLAGRLGLAASTVNRWATGQIPVAPYVPFVLELLELLDLDDEDARGKPQDRPGAP
jgi:transcriptional regulator with XRE-family HTH domain